MATATHKKTKRGLLIKTDGEMRLVEVATRGLADYYKLIDTDIVERTPGSIEGYMVEIWCDEEGCFKADNYLNLMLLSLSGRQIVRDVVVHSRSLDKIVEKLRADGVVILEGEDDDNDR
jgi:hypothetical protein